MILQALREGYSAARYGGHTRYQCSCGYKYIVADCGEAVQEGTCPDCGRTVGGVTYGHNRNQRLDARPQQGGRGQAGYFQHVATRDATQGYRELNPLGFRALHFLLHAAMLARCFEARGCAHVAELADLLEHLKADWEVMRRILGAEPAGFLMAVAGAATKKPCSGLAVKPFKRFWDF